MAAPAELPRLKEELAAAYRICAAHGLHEGVCNHLTICFHDPRASQGSASLVIAHGWDWSEVTPERLLVFDNHTGKIIEGEGDLEISAFQIHSAIHLNETPGGWSHAVIFHTHMPYATALTSLNPKDGRLQMCNQNSLRYYDDVAYDDQYNGVVEGAEEGVRLAKAMGKNRVMFMHNHGVLVVGRNCAEAWDDLYFLERCCEVQTLAMSTGRPIDNVDDATCAATKEQIMRGLPIYAKKHFQAQQRLHPPPYEENIPKHLQPSKMYQGETPSKM